MYTLNILNREYNWTVSVKNTTSFTSLDGFNPWEHKLFNGDQFIYDESKGIVELLESPLRTNKCIPGVLILDDNKTYGREINGLKQGRLLYKCIPDDIRIPIFLVPYEIKEMGFSKIFPNLYVTIFFKQWEHKDKHPIANISQTIGPVDELINFYEYQLYCKELNWSIQSFNKDTIKAIKQIDPIDDICRNYCLEDRTGTDWKVFTIDPDGCKDYDDAFSIKTLDSDNNKTLLSIYIANVAIWMDFLNLWNSFSKRTSTIYLPDRNRPMLPTILSNSLCSLQERERRFAFTMDIIFDNNNKQISSISYVNTCIKVFKNFVYEEPKLVVDKDYKYLLQTVRHMSQTYKYINNIQDSHEVVSYLMICMNYFCSQELFKSGNGIFRTNIININPETDVPEDVYKYIKLWNSNGAEYKIIDKEEETTMRHDTLNLETYVHITSPIRRLVDLLNLIQIQTNKSLVSFSKDATQFYNKWKQNIDFINKSMKSIRKIQNECDLLHKCFHNDMLKLNYVYDGYFFNKTCYNNIFQYTVYLPELKLTSYLKTTEEFAEYEKKQIKLFLFNNKDKFKQKIRLALV
jgi:exoribonuclease R